MPIDISTRRLSETDFNEDEIWRSYNFLLLSPDLARIRKMLVRYRLFEQCLDVPGDIVECGVFKGAGIAYWAKLLEIFSSNSRKRVIGFDVFGPFRQVALKGSEQKIASLHDQLTRGEGVAREDVAKMLALAGLQHRTQLIEGDISKTAFEYVSDNYGFRISLLHLDLDTYEGTMKALDAFWPVVSKGGIVIFDEYAIPGMGESQAVDEYFADKDERPIAVPYAETPTAYLIKA